MKLFANAQYLTLGELPSELQFDLMKAIYISGSRNKTYFFSNKKNLNFENRAVKIRLPC